jgi:hypothetical protein
MNTASPSEGAHAALVAACAALWSATLSLMTAYMQQPAPAHRLSLARRISRNFDTLAQQQVFTLSSRQSFVRLSLRWQVNAGHLEDTASGQRPAGPTVALLAQRKHTM